MNENHVVLACIDEQNNIEVISTHLFENYKLLEKLILI
jgi:hypothetical protein